MTERQHLMKKLMAERFAAIETAIFLDTHPRDEKRSKRLGNIPKTREN